MSYEPVHPWRGIYPAMITPLRDDERLDEDSAARLVVRLLDQGVAGLYLTGSTGEAWALDDAVRVAAFRIAAQAAAGRGTLIAHVGGVMTRRAVRLAEAAADAGLDAVSALPPYGSRYDFDEVLHYYRDLAAHSPLPLIVYHLPKVTGYDLNADQMSRILELKNVAGMKYTEYDMFLLETLISRFPHLPVFNGADESLLAGLAVGAVGAIGSNYNALAPVALAIAACFWAGDLAGAREAQSALNRCVEVYFSTPRRLQALKRFTAEVFGLPVPPPPSPALAADEKAMARFREAFGRALRAYPLR